MSAHDCTQKKDPLLKSNTKILIIDLDLALRGHSKNTLTWFWPFLTTYLPFVDIFKGYPLLLWNKIRWNIHIVGKRSRRVRSGQIYKSD